MFKYVGTHGLPLEVVLETLKKNNMVIDWMNYATDALREGHNPRTIKARILEAVGDVYGPKDKEKINNRLNLMFDRPKVE